MHWGFWASLDDYRPMGRLITSARQTTSTRGDGTPIRGLVAAFALQAMLLLGGGCATNHASLTLASLNANRDYSQSFTNCYATATDNGDWDIVMISAPAGLGASTSALPLQPAHVEPRQIVHVRVLWKPPGGMSLDQVAASNAMVEWFLVGDDESREDLVEYAGTAFVSLDQSGKRSSVVIKNASLRPVVCRGHMCDPLGPSKLTGSIAATEDGSQVQHVLDEERQLLQSPDLAGGPQAHPISSAVRPGIGALP